MTIDNVNKADAFLQKHISTIKSAETRLVKILEIGV